jgi:acyl dehydratase
MSRTYEYWFEDFTLGAVHEFGHKTVTKEEIVRFASEFDPQPFHLDEAVAARSPFGGLVASGWHTCAMAMRMLCDAYLLDAASVGSPGVDELHWRKPVRPGDVLRVRTTVLEARALKSRPNLGVVRHRWEVLNQKDEVVMDMIGNAMFLRRTPG